MFTELKDFIESLTPENISAERKNILKPLIAYIQDKKNQNEKIILNFICTHNSRRSHLSQVWAQAIANYCGINGVETYSGGTEATALFPQVVTTLKDNGFKIQALSESKNPIYSIRFNQSSLPIVGFSKKFDDAFNANQSFAAVMTCADADTNCPVVFGAEQRIALNYLDPKVADNTPQMVEKYQERSQQIATEMLYVFSQIK